MIRRTKVSDTIHLKVYRYYLDIHVDGAWHNIDSSVKYLVSLVLGIRSDFLCNLGQDQFPSVLSALYWQETRELLLDGIPRTQQLDLLAFLVCQRSSDDFISVTNLISATDPSDTEILDIIHPKVTDRFYVRYDMYRLVGRHEQGFLATFGTNTRRYAKNPRIHDLFTRTRGWIPPPPKPTFTT